MKKLILFTGLILLLGACKDKYYEEPKVKHPLLDSLKIVDTPIPETISNITL